LTPVAGLPAFGCLAAAERAERLAVAAERMRAAGAEAVIESVADLPALLPRLVSG
jgi:hypothetical protein